MCMCVCVCVAHVYVCVQYVCVHGCMRVLVLVRMHIVVVRLWESSMRCLANATFPQSDN